MRLAQGSHIGLQELSNPAIPAAEKDQLINKTEHLLEDKYLQYCDPQIPMHIMAKYIAKFSIGNMRITVHHGRQRTNQGLTIADEEKDYIFIVCLEILEGHIAIRYDNKLKGFIWYLKMNMPFTSFVHVLLSLRERTSGILADRAWATVINIVEYFVRPQVA